MIKLARFAKFISSFKRFTQQWKVSRLPITLGEYLCTLVFYAELTQLPYSRRILSTHFPSSLRANLAIDAAIASSNPVIWVPGTWNTSTKAHAHSSDESSDEEGEEEQPWRSDEPASTQARSGNKDGLAVCQVVRGTVRYIAPVKADSERLYFSRLTRISSSLKPAFPSLVDPLIPLTFLTELHEVLQNYIAGTVSEASLKVRLDSSSSFN